MMAWNKPKFSIDAQGRSIQEIYGEFSQIHFHQHKLDFDMPAMCDGFQRIRVDVQEDTENRKVRICIIDRELIN